MKIKENIIESVFNPYEFLPTYGENKLEISIADSKLCIDVFYDLENGKESKMTIVFGDIVFHLFQSFPGVEMTKFKHQHYTDFDNLVEIKDSEAKLIWEKHFDNLLELKHYKIFFTAQNKLLEVICKDFKVLKNQ